MSAIDVPIEEFERRMCDEVIDFPLARELLDALESSRSEVEALRHEVAQTNEHEHQILTERNEARAEMEQARIELEDERERVNVQREDIRTLRAKAQRLREGVRCACAQMTVADLRREMYDNDVEEIPESAIHALDAANRWYAARLQAGAVVVPEPNGISFFADGRDPEKRRRDVLQGIHWARLNARIVYPATCKDGLQVPHAPPQPTADVVVVPREEYRALESVRHHAQEVADGIREMGPSRLSEPLEHALAALDAIRSSTNDDSKETP